MSLSRQGVAPGAASIRDGHELPASRKIPMRLQCPRCGTELLVEDDNDQVVTCTGCQAKLRAPISDSIADTDDEDDSADAPLAHGGGDDGKYQDLVDMTAMVDIVFFLLIFFMITSAAGILSCINVPKPKQDSAAATTRRTAADLEQDSECVTVRIDNQNRIFIDDIEFPTEADLRERLRGAKALNAKKLLVKAHGDAFNGTFVMVQDLGQDLGFEEFSLSVAKEEEQQQ